ncbi:MAG: glutathione S-transferase family protein [Betaproteobacteria bacterium]|nr:glutathione S-transferase family protein [Betaproteobacteria bacterium]
MSLKIYGIAASRAARPLWVAQELGLTYEHVPIHYAEGATRTAEFLRLNPNGHIPVIDDDGVVVWESMACALYLAQRFKAVDGSSLAGQTPAEQADVLRWTFWAVTECEKDALSALMHTVAMAPERRKPELAQEAAARLKVPLKVLEQHLADGRAFLAGSRFTVADICVASVLAWAKPAADLFQAHPLAAAWLDRCLSRPAQQAVRALGRKS